MHASRRVGLVALFIAAILLIASCAAPAPGFDGTTPSSDERPTPEPMPPGPRLASSGADLAAESEVAPVAADLLDAPSGPPEDSPSALSVAGATDLDLDTGSSAAAPAGGADLVELDESAEPRVEHTQPVERHDAVPAEPAVAHAEPVEVPAPGGGTTLTAADLAPMAALRSASPESVSVGVEPSLAAAAVVQGATDAVVLSRGHVDLIEVTVDSGALRMQVKDETAGAAVYRSPELVQLRVLEAARTTVPSAQFGLLGAVGSAVYLLPQIQDADLVWPGWSTERIPGGAVDGDAIAMRLVGSEGPGSVAVFTTDQFGAPTVLFDGGGPAPDEIVVPIHTHAHANWAFTAAGTYQLTFEVAATVDGAATSTRATYVVLVGDAATPPPAGTVGPPTVTGGPNGAGSAAGGAASAGSHNGGAVVGSSGVSGGPATGTGPGAGSGALASTGVSSLAVASTGLVLIVVGMSILVVRQLAGFRRRPGAWHR